MLIASTFSGRSHISLSNSTDLSQDLCIGLFILTLPTNHCQGSRLYKQPSTINDRSSIHCGMLLHSIGWLSRRPTSIPWHHDGLLQPRRYRWFDNAGVITQQSRQICRNILLCYWYLQQHTTMHGLERQQCRWIDQEKYCFGNASYAWQSWRNSGVFHLPQEGQSTVHTGTLHSHRNLEYVGWNLYFHDDLLSPRECKERCCQET